MSTQSSAGIPVSLLPEEQHQHFRLLELPPELLEILTSANPPTLYFKSSEVAPGEPAGNAVLCTHDKTYNIRQKNSSNTVYVLQPHDTNDESGKQRMQIISQPQSTLETTSAQKTCAAAYIRQLLPVLSSTGQSVGARSSLTKAQLFVHVPESDAECEVAFRQLTVFVNEHGRCVLPSAQLCLDTWHSILAAARARPVDLTASLSSSSIETLRNDVREVSDLQGSLVSAVIDSVVPHHEEGTDTGVRIDASVLLRWLGVTRLEAVSAKTSTAVSVFRSAWKDDMPEPWRSKADLALMTGRYILSDGGKSIQFRDYQLDLEDDTSSSTAPDGKATAGSKRKQWHEKFRPSKKPT
ncbi:hypothetical protein LTR95_013734 [Oleoguttula sp. CCFEE 5521]